MIYSNTRAAIAAILGVAGALAPFAAAQAQTAAPEADTLQEVIITAERRATDVQTTPLAVTAVSGDELISKQVVGITSLSLAAPSISMYDRGGTFTGVNIRGIGNSSNVPNIQSGVAVIRDGTYLPEPIGHNVPFYDIADTEVLRGPQGTFVGASAVGGAVLINSKNPVFDGATSGFASYEIGDYSVSKLQAAINLPVSDTFAARVAVNSGQRGSFYKNSKTIYAGTPTSPHSDPGSVADRNVRLSLQWKPSAKSDVLFKYENNQTNMEGTINQMSTTTFVPLINTGNCTTAAPAASLGAPATALQITCAPYTGAPIHGNAFYNPNAGYNQSPYNLDYDNPGTKFNMQQVSYILDAHFTFDNDIVLRSVTGHRHFHVIDTIDTDLTALPRAVQYHEIGPNNNYYSQEFTLQSPTEQRLSWTTGAFWFYRDTVVRSSTYTYNMSANNFTGSPVGYDGKIFACPAPIAGGTVLGAVPAGCPVANPNTPILNAAGVLQGYVPGLIYYTGQQIGNVNFGSQGAVQRMGALFGKVTFKINDQLDIEGGLRWSWDKNFQYSDNSRIGQFAVSYVRDTSGSPTVGAPNFNPNYNKLNGYMSRANCSMVSATQSGTTAALGSGGGCLDTRASVANPDSEPSYKIGLNWTPTDGQFGYLFYAHGYKAAGLGSQQNALPLRSFNVEKVNDIEAGWKSKLFNNRVNTSIGVYYTTDDGFQYNLFDPTTTATAVGNLGGTTKLYGLEGSINARLSGWNIDGSFAIMKSKLGTATQVPTYLLGTLVGGSATINGVATTTNATNTSQCGPATAAGARCFDYTPYAVALGGFTNPLAPQFTANLQVGYEFLVGNGIVRPRVNFAYTGKAYGSLFQTTDTFIMNARALWNANLDFENGPWTVSAYGTNLTNVWYQTDSGSTTNTFWGAPRQVGIRFTRKF
jgi:outer membrane receptor protein involved in Fe transport